MRIRKTLAPATLLILAGIAAFTLVGCREKGAPPAPAQTSSSTASAATFVNAKCPIMGTAIDPANVPAELTREYKGKKVAFCCGGCPVAWDKLTDAEKDEKLAQVTK